MSQPFFQLSGGGDQLLRMQTGESVSREMTEGKLVVAEVLKSTSDGETTLKISGQKVTVNLESTLPKGGLLVGRVVESDDQQQVRLLNTLKEFQAIQNRELMDLLKNQQLDSSRSSVPNLKNTLLSRGYIPPLENVKSDHTGGSSPPDSGESRFLIPVNQESAQTSFRSGETLVATVQEIQSDGQAVLEMKDQAVSVRMSQRAGLQEGQLLELRVSDRESSKQFEIIRRQNPELPREQITRLLGELGKQVDSESLDFTRRILRSTVDRSPDTVLRRLTLPTPDRAGTQFSPEARNAAEQFLNTPTEANQERKEILQKLHTSLNLNSEIRDEDLQLARQIQREIPNQDPEQFLKRYRHELSRIPSSQTKFSPALRQQAEQLIQSYRKPETSPNSRQEVSRLEQQIEKLLRDMNRDHSEPSRRKVRQFLTENRNARPDQLLQFIRDRVPLADALERPELKTLLEAIQRDLRPTSNSVSTAERSFSSSTSVEKMIRELGRRPMEENLELVKRVLEEDSSPSRKLLDQLLSHQSSLVDTEGEIDPERLKKAISLFKRGVPITDQLMRDIRRDLPLDQLRQIWQETPELPRLNPERGNLPRQIQQILQSMGFDMEAQLQKDPEQALRSLRSVLSTILGSTEGESSTSMDLSRQDARAILNQIVQHSLASRSEDGTLYLFIPFQEGEESRMMRVRFEDKRDDSGQELDNQWGVTVEVSLSQLGEMRINVRRRQDHLGIRVQPRQPDTARLIRDRRDKLETGLGRLGYSSRIRVKRMEEEFTDWPSKELYESTDQGVGRLDFTI